VCTVFRRFQCVRKPAQCIAFDERPRASPAAPAPPSTIESIFVADHLNIEIIKKQKQQPAEFNEIKFKQKLSNTINDKLIRLAPSKSNK